MALWPTDGSERRPIWASVVEVRSRDLTASAKLPMAPGTSLLAWRDESSLPPAGASALMEGDVRQGGGDVSTDHSG